MNISAKKIRKSSFWWFFFFEYKPLQIEEKQNYKRCSRRCIQKQKKNCILLIGKVFFLPRAYQFNQRTHSNIFKRIAFFILISTQWFSCGFSWYRSLHPNSQTFYGKSFILWKKKQQQTICNKKKCAGKHHKKNFSRKFNFQQATVNHSGFKWSLLLSKAQVE